VGRVEASFTNPFAPQFSFYFGPIEATILECLEQAIRAAVPEWSFAEVVTALQAMRAIDLIATVAVIAEIGDLSRLQDPRELMGYPGARALRELHARQ
jgi:hypothetical protein